MTVKYILYPGMLNEVWFSPEKLCQLYAVDREETATFSDGVYWHKGCVYKPSAGTRLRKLTPREDGNYLIELNVGYL